ncbi:hypothetical protein F751_0946 [Auxenochlorella protothecoides]|uniref:Elongator complex protein 5 n=2 Tax=Auxenochlorella protothecoides TaxID=3075 RepID=A0A087SDC8_AUXPR|nr:hypothetical protein F751_0946 [Auxenochlorella protothecoides]KFM23732.1 hypothetical protein F751_0946 [Auxenochlorella protothecoides]
MVADGPSTPVPAGTGPSVRAGVAPGAAPPPGPGVAGGMKLGLTPEESAARSSVQLPYERQGQALQQLGTDFREYLPRAAGGRGSTTNHVLYVRDSDSEHDSDEDPDDDIDI